MKDFEISPPFFSPMTILYGVVAIGTNVFLGLMVLPKLFDLYQVDPNSPVVFQIGLSLGVVMAVTWLFFIFAGTSSRGKKIEVAGNLVYFKKRTMLGLGKWTIEKLIDFSKVTHVKDRQRRGYVYTGKAVVPYVIYWLIFEMENGSKQEIVLNGWDNNSMKQLFYYLRGRFPKIHFDNVLLKDSPEKLSGLDEYLHPQKTGKKS